MGINNSACMIVMMGVHLPLDSWIPIPIIFSTLKSVYGMRKMHQNTITDFFTSTKYKLDDCHDGPSFL